MSDEHTHTGLAADLALMARPLPRRDVLAWLATALTIPILGCGEDKGADSGGGDTGLGDPTDTGDSATWDDTCSVIPEETAGPYPGDGSNGPNALTLDDIVRSDIRSSVGALSGTAEGVGLKVRMRLVNASDGCTPLAGYAIYLWHCDRDGDYSLYTNTSQNYLRGVQVTDADGVVSFTTIFPGCYSGRWPHIHFEVYPSLADTSSSRNVVATSQLAMPEDSCALVYAVSGYEASVPNFASASLDTDNVFSDGADTQLPAMSGDPSAGLVATITVGIAV